MRLNDFEFICGQNLIEPWLVLEKLEDDGVNLKTLTNDELRLFINNNF